MSWTPPSRWRHDDGNTPSGNIKSIVAMATELTPLEPPDSHLLNAAEGWLELENWLEANEELELITPRNRAHPSIVRMRWLIYGKAKKWELAMEVGRLLSEMLPDNYFGFACYAYA